MRPMPFSATARAALAPSMAYQATGSASGSNVGGFTQNKASSTSSRLHDGRGVSEIHFKYV